ncbi:MAG: hypothetical protein A3K08_02235 [Candidatus Doudnabacteria bacterium RIFCSPLOWO2_01_41_7]|nr:MAG: hypothetical protein A3K08_02235 [Candidatus Doudnabacteria bacterium RIFCSPLOWO2_01_41_7]
MTISQRQHILILVEEDMSEKLTENKRVELSRYLADNGLIVAYNEINKEIPDMALVAGSLRRFAGDLQQKLTDANQKLELLEG